MADVQAKPAFDDSKPFQPAVVTAQNKPEFDPNQPFQPANATPEDRPWTAAAYGAGQGALFGYLPQVKAAIQTGSFSSPAYIKARDDMNDQLTSLHDSNPWSYGAGNAGGFVASSLLPGGIAAKAGEGAMALTGLAEAPRLVQAGARVAGMAGLGGTEAAAMNPGDVKGELSGPQLGERFENAKSGAELGAVGGAVGEAAKGAVSGLQDLRKSAILRQTGASANDLQKMFNKKTLDETVNFLREKKIVQAGDTFENVAQKSNAIKQATGSDLENLYSTVTKKIESPEVMSNLSEDAQNEYLNDRFAPGSQKEEILSYINNKLKGQVGKKAAVNQISDTLDQWVGEYGDDVSVKTANDLKGFADQRVNYNKSLDDAPINQSAYKALRDYISDKINKQVGFVDNHFGGDLAEKLKGLNKDYGISKNIEAIANHKDFREQANRMFGLTDSIAGGVGLGVSGAGEALKEGRFGAAAVKGALGVAGGLLTNKAGRTYGPGLIAGGANLGGKALSFSRPALQNLPVGLLSPVVQSDAFDKYNPPQKFRLTGK